MTPRKLLKIPMLACEVHIEVVDNVRDTVNKLNKKLKINEVWADTDQAEGVVINSSLSKYYLIYGKQYISHNLIAHEIYHIAQRITKDRCIADEESGAWVAGYVSQAVYSFLIKKGFTIK